MEPGGTLEGLRIAQEKGLCSYLGITGRAIPLLSQLASTGEFDTVLVYHDYHPCRRLAAKSLLPAAMLNDMGVVVATILAGGLYVEGISKKSALRFLSESERANAEQILDRLLLEDSTLPQSAFQYVLADGRVTTASSGAANVEQLMEVVSATNIGSLSEGCMKLINKIPSFQ
jgi:aryl-alcohol dehydrogenase-like predicted oxidoreductase